MLFSSKRRLRFTFLPLVLFTIVALAAHRLLDLQWSWSLRPLWLLAGLTMVAASDGLLHGILGLLFGRRYLLRYNALVDYFSSQGGLEIVVGGLLAGSEELFFRGVLLQGAIEQLGWSAAAALLVSSLTFAAMHLVRAPILAPFAVWAFWEGVLLGAVYMISGSLLTAVLVHSLHDIAGFVLFSHQRHSG